MNQVSRILFSDYWFNSRYHHHQHHQGLMSNIINTSQASYDIIYLHRDWFTTISSVKLHIQSTRTYLANFSLVSLLLVSGHLDTVTLLTTAVLALRYMLRRLKQFFPVYFQLVLPIDSPYYLHFLSYVFLFYHSSPQHLHLCSINPIDMLFFNCLTLKT